MKVLYLTQLGSMETINFLVESLYVQNVDLKKTNFDNIIIVLKDFEMIF